MSKLNSIKTINELFLIDVLRLNIKLEMRKEKWKKKKSKLMKS